MNLTSIRPVLAALGAGVLTTLAFAPFGVWPLAMLGPALLFGLWLKHSGAGFRLGFAYGLGLMGSGVTWLFVSLHEHSDIGLFWSLLMTTAFVIFMALFYGLSGWLLDHFKTSDRLKLLTLIPALWVLVEWLRGWFLTGFPWLDLGYSQIDTPLAGYATVLGSLGVSLCVALSAGVLLLLFRASRIRWYLFAGLVLLWLGGWGLEQVQWSRAKAAPLEVVLIQGNIPQDQKWNQDQLGPSLTLYARRSMENLGADLIVWPETAVSTWLHLVEVDFLQPLEQVLQTRGSELVFGVVRLDEDGKRYFNSMVVLGKQRDHYSKRHLVPFTEYLPLKAMLGGLVDFFNFPMSDFTAGDKSKPLMRIGDHQVGMSICYEAAFGTEIAQALPEAAYLINTSNDAWFGKSLAPYQHLQIARMRALETGRYLLRSTNTGISAIIGPKGELIATTPLLEEAVLKGEILPMSGTTPFARFGNMPLLALSGLLLVIGFPCAYTRRCSTGKDTA